MPSSSLTPTQLEVLGALVKGSSVTAAARAAGLHRTTIHHWSRVLPDFRALLQDARNSRAEAVADSLYDLSDKAIDAVRYVLEDKEAPVTQRLKAALAVINSAVSRPRALPTGNITAEEFDLIVDDISEMENPTGDGLTRRRQQQNPPLRPALPPNLRLKFITFHHNSSQKKKFRLPDPRRLRLLLKHPVALPAPAAAARNSSAAAAAALRRFSTRLRSAASTIKCMSGPLSGIRVIDFGRFIAGPYCGMLLADMGADVIRIDRRNGSEDRFTGPVTEDGVGGAFLSLNRNKRSLTLDTSKPEARDIIRRLVAGADVVLANLPIQVMNRMGLDYDTLRGIKPGIILARVSTFGPDGPYASRSGFDTIAQAMSGAMSLTGFPGPPVRALVPFEDYGTALHTAFGIMVALYHRTMTGEGQIVDGSLFATGVTFMQAFLAERHVTGIERTQRGNAAFYSAPADTYRTTDGWITVQVIGPDMFARWAKLVNREDFLSDARFADDLARADQREHITAAMNAWLATRTTREALQELDAARVPAGPVHTLDQVLDDPQVKARQLLQFEDYPGAPKPVPLASTAVRLSATPGSIRQRAPLPGEHTVEVLQQLAYTEIEIAAFQAAGVV
jgi:crotonobetainyl-CoA:carnitine CoA-transferase CaiB-like acyl-CoA transferase